LHDARDCVRSGLPVWRHPPLATARRQVHHVALIVIGPCRFANRNAGGQDDGTMGGFGRYLMLTAKAKTGLTPAFPILLVAAAIMATATFILLNVVIYIWCAQNFGPLPTAIGMTAAYLVLCIV